MERPISSNALAQVQAAIFDGNKIEAIRIYRQDTGSSLSDAKDAVEKLEAEWRGSSPEKFKAPARRRGCGGCLALVIVLGVLVAIFLMFFVHRSR
ncbi:MAG TPA: hypothetical protein VJ063_00420 [Verrucomicrobiae bacterium]|nr:hypothetical protein [Verrucomicrobiae bacterium]